MPKASMKPAEENDGKNESPSIHTSAQPEQNDEKRPKVQSVQFKLPTNVLNLSGSLNQVSSAQMVILMTPQGVMLSSFDERVKRHTLVPWGNVKAITYQEADETV